ncbi:ROK family protein [Actinoplanes sp. M2I2]|uniref:ROK family protein n=1 Tax=Actinoplanes sp. M2I2 TaxID=1734444 RepID=UPI0020215D7D|nr:ROK family protein [Actinoplanes sp. M2I2]
MTTRSTELLRVVHARPGVTRADAARLLGIGTGATTELVVRLTGASLLAEAPAARSGARGRPTTALVAHPGGPVVAAVAITHRTWRVDVVELGGRALSSVSGAHSGATWAEVAAGVAEGAAAVRETYAERVRAVGVSVPGPVTADLRLDATISGWLDVDLRGLWPDGPLLVAGNDASLAATAESARGAAAGASVALHLLIEYGLGGAVVDQGRLVIGAHGASGEFGHMPFGDPAVLCPCGARGCWGTTVDGTALARHLGHPVPPDPVAYARTVIASSGAAERAAVRAVATALGRGTAGLVNGLDADLVTLGGLGADLLAAAPAEVEAAYRAGLMALRRESPPPLVPAALGADGPIAGAAEAAWSALLGRLG